MTVIHMYKLTSNDQSRQLIMHTDWPLIAYPESHTPVKVHNWLPIMRTTSKYKMTVTWWPIMTAIYPSVQNQMAYTDSYMSESWRQTANTDSRIPVSTNGPLMADLDKSSDDAQIDHLAHDRSTHLSCSMHSSAICLPIRPAPGLMPPSSPGMNTDLDDWELSPVTQINIH